MQDRVAMTVADGIADVRMNRPEKLNALDPAMFDALIDTIERLGTVADLRAVVLSGEGRGFCAGLDMASMTGGTAALDDRAHGIANRYQQVAWGWRTLPVPVIAALHGPVLGGGLQIASGADIRIAAPDTRLSVMELKWGIVPDMAGHVLWRGLVRADLLRECIYTAREFDGEEAARLGFVTRIAADPLAEAMALARAIAGRNPDAIRAAKRLAARAAEAGAEAVLAAEAREQAALIGSANQMEAVRANLSGRAPVFTDQTIF
ncbi:crotonase/enoyl-CoA hydratase family protein [Sphingomonas sp. IW22]|uniref:crotonase/enoyl-CoA hydratase family protein n=1 Tax=Sphingomonas sp. IW22 TaxID=3242489 RepID=UPI0035225189